MADSVSTILDYLRQHHFLEAEAALKAELAGREVSNGLFSLSLGVESVQDNAEKLPVKESVEGLLDFKPEKQLPSGRTEKTDIRPISPSSAHSSDLYSTQVKSSSSEVHDAGAETAQTYESLPAYAEEKRKDIDKPHDKTVHETTVENCANKLKVGAESSIPGLGEGFWEQKDELLWVSGNQGLQLGKVHPLDELGYPQGKGLHAEQKHKMPARRQGTKSLRNMSMDAKDEQEFSRQISTNAQVTSESVLFPAVDVPKSGGVLEKHSIKQDVVRQQDLFAKAHPTMALKLEASADKARSSQEVRADNVDTTERAEGLPRLPPVRLKSVEIPDEWVAHCRTNSEADIETGILEASSYALGSFLDVPVGQDISSSGTKRSVCSNRPSVSHGIVEDPSELLSSFATVGDGSAIDYPDEYWDSDAYEDDDDPGYTRRPIEDETAFLANEINYPSEEERARSIEHATGQQGTAYGKYDDDDRSYVESYFSGEEYYRSRDARHSNAQVDTDVNALCGTSGVLSFRQHAKEYDGQLLDSEELKQIRSEPAWQGFVVQGNSMRKDQPTTTGLADLDPDDFSREIRETYLAESSEGDVGSLQDCEFQGDNTFDVNELGEPFGGTHYSESNSRQGFREIGGPSSAEDDHDMVLQYYGRQWVQKGQPNGSELSNVLDMEQERNGSVETQRPEDQLTGFQFGGFSFPSPSSAGDVDGSRAESGRSLWSARDISSRGDDGDHFANGFVGPDDTLASWKRKSNESSPIISPGEEDNDLHLALSTRSTISPGSTDDCLSVEEERVDDEDADAQREDTEVAAAYDEEAIAVHEHFQRLQAEEEEFETFDLKIIHRKNRTGFEEDKDFPVVINSVIAGRYHVTEYLGSAAFSKAIQAHDLHSGMDVCMKIIKNNKDFFDQSLDEIKLLKYINKHDPADKYHILRLYDYFYHREHLFIVCELLRANLYEFHKYNRDSGGEVYFTMPRLQSITRQCLEALEFLHGLGLIHCDLKPENILVKSYSRCEVKVIDLGSSCFQSDHLCSYVQSRSYRAPEVILGLPYDQKIDIWSLGCILAELCSGNVLFQNDSLATLLARVAGIIGPLDPEMVAKGRESFKFLTKNNLLYERNQDTNRMEYLIPKKTTLAHRLPMGDQGFVEFVGYLLQINPRDRPSATEALKHPWLSYPYEPISS